MKKEIISLGKVNLSNKVIIANPSIKNQDNNFIVNDIEMDILEGKYNVYVTKCNEHNEYNGEITEVTFMHTDYYKEKQTIESIYAEKWGYLHTIDTIEASASDYMCITGVFNSLIFKNKDKYNFYKKCCSIMNMGAHNPIFKINDRVMFKIISLDWLNILVLREQKENKIIAFLIDSRLEEYLSYIG